MYKYFCGLFATLALLAGPQLILAQQWPDKPIKMIVPFAAGGSADILGRILSV